MSKPGQTLEGIYIHRFKNIWGPSKGEYLEFAPLDDHPELRSVDWQHVRRVLTRIAYQAWEKNQRPRKQKGKAK